MVAAVDFFGITAGISILHRWPDDGIRNEPAAGAIGVASTPEFDLMLAALHSLGLAALVSVCTVAGATAGERFGYEGYPGGYGFANEAIGGDYIGAPFTRFPRPSELVPSAWGYGTYGVPTVTGIRQAPTAAPTLTVINADEPAPRRRGMGPRILSRGSEGRWAGNARGTEPDQGGVRVISVTVPRR